MAEVRDGRDLLSGALLIAVGACIVGYGLFRYRLGTLTNMGPGFFPVLTGALMVLCGVCIAVPALKGKVALPKFELRPALAVLGSGVVFAAFVQWFGLIPAVVSMVIIASLGDDKLSWRVKLMLAVALAVISSLIFKVGLGLPVPYAKWFN